MTAAVCEAKSIARRDWEEDGGVGGGESGKRGPRRPGVTESLKIIEGMTKVMVKRRSFIPHETILHKTPCSK